MAKDDKKMADVKKVEEPIIEFQELKQKQNVLNLDTQDDSEIVVVTKRIVWKNGTSTDAKLKELQKLIHPAEKQVEALQRFFEAESYRESKDAALGKGNFLTVQLRSAIVGLMQQYPAFQELSAKDCFTRWLEGYKAGKKGPQEFLQRAKAAMAATEMDF